MDFTDEEKRVMEIASKSECIIFGGFFRDKILGKDYKDIDIYCGKNLVIDTKIPLDFSTKNPLNIKSDLDCNSILYKNKKLFSLYDKNLENIIKNIKNKTCKPFGDFNESRKKYMESKGFTIQPN